MTSPYVRRQRLAVELRRLRHRQLTLRQAELMQAEQVTEPLVGAITPPGRELIRGRGRRQGLPAGPLPAGPLPDFGLYLGRPPHQP